jgi:hypothetical protein
MEEMQSQSTPVQRLKVAILPLDLLCSGPITHSGDISITGKSHKKKPDGSSKDDTEMEMYHDLNIKKSYNTLPLPTLLYGSENWTIKARDATKLTAAEMK